MLADQNEMNDLNEKNGKFLTFFHQVLFNLNVEFPLFLKLKQKEKKKLGVIFSIFIKKNMQYRKVNYLVQYYPSDE